MYSKTHWQDRVVDPETGEVVQEGTFMSAEHFNNMEDGIEANDTAISEISESVETIETTLDTGVGTTITLTVNSSTFVMKLALKNSEGDILSESEVDLPIESMIVNAEYVEATKSLVLTLQSGSKVTVPLSALINGLVNDTRKVAGMDLKKDITVAEMVTALGVDKKANKTSVSSGENSTTSVINVTDAKAQMAMVAKISGKTQKVIQLISSAVSSVTNVSITAKNVRYAGGITFVLNHKYLMTGTCSVGGIRFQSDGVVGLCVITTQANQKIYKTFTCSRANFDSQPYLYNDRSETITISGEFQLFDLTEMFGAGKEPTEEQCKTLDVFKGYIAPTTGTLWSAPVESVVSVGKNLIDYARTKLGYYDTSGNWNNANHIRCTDRITVQSGKRYYLSGMTGEGRAIFWNGNTIVSNPLITPPASVVAPVGATEMIFQENASGFPPTAQIEEGTAATPYTPYNKTTVLVPSEVRNCVGYGLSVNGIANVVDFENGTYTQNIGIMKLDELTWNYRNDGTSFAPYFWTEFSNKTIKVKGTVNDAQNILNAKYPTIGRTSPTVFVDKTICADGTSTAISQIQIKDSAYTTVAAFKESLKGQILLYEKYSPETKPLTDYIRPLPVEQGGTLTLVNEHNLDVNSVIKYKKEVN